MIGSLVFHVVLYLTQPQNPVLRLYKNIINKFMDKNPFFCRITPSWVKQVMSTQRGIT